MFQGCDNAQSNTGRRRRAAGDAQTKANPVPVEWHGARALAGSRWLSLALAICQCSKCRGGRRKTGDTDVGVFRLRDGRVLFAAEGWQAGRSLMAAFECCD